MPDSISTINFTKAQRLATFAFAKGLRARVLTEDSIAIDRRVDGKLETSYIHEWDQLLALTAGRTILLSEVA